MGRNLLLVALLPRCGGGVEVGSTLLIVAFIGEDFCMYTLLYFGMSETG